MPTEKHKFVETPANNHKICIPSDILKFEELTMLSSLKILFDNAESFLSTERISSVRLREGELEPVLWIFETSRMVLTLVLEWLLMKFECWPGTATLWRMLDVFWNEVTTNNFKVFQVKKLLLVSTNLCSWIYISTTVGR